MSEKNIATIEISLPSEDLAKIVYQALRPELKKKAQMDIKGNIITLDLKGKTVATLRAAYNSYLRWIGMIEQVVSMVNINFR